MTISLKKSVILFFCIVATIQMPHLFSSVKKSVLSGSACALAVGVISYCCTKDFKKASCYVELHGSGVDVKAVRSWKKDAGQE